MSITTVGYLFVKATSLLCQREVTVQQVNEGNFVFME